MSLRRARQSDHEAVRRLCEDIWSDRNGDYLPNIYPAWIKGDDRETLVATHEDELVGIAQCVMLNDEEAWCQGLRVRSDMRGNGIAETLMSELFSWAALAGATVARTMVFSWNGAGMGVARGVGFNPTTSVRFVTPVPADEARPTTVVADGTRGWKYWRESVAQSHLQGLGLDDTESWSMRKLRSSDMTNSRILAVVEDGCVGMALRGRREQVSDNGETIVRQEYMAAAWQDIPAAETLLRAIAIDAFEQGATHTRVTIPEDIRLVSDVAVTGVAIDEAPHFIFSAPVGRISD